jgi:hypothetical protein
VTQKRNPEERIPIAFKRIKGQGYFIETNSKPLDIATIMKFTHEIKGNKGTLYVPKSQAFAVLELNPTPISGE